jgi:ParB-like chromosome segregation protein Spo0J
MNMQFHEIANVWPLLDDDKLQELAADIRANGLVNPIWTYEGKVLDGRNRYKACLLASVAPKFNEYKGDEPTAFAVSMNDKRRHMNKGQLGAIGAELEQYFAKDAARRKKETEGRPKKEVQKPVAKLPQVMGVKFDESHIKEQDAKDKYESGKSIEKAFKARQEAAKSVGVGERYVQDAKKVKQEAPEVFEKLKAGKITMQDAKREVAKKPTDDWRKDERDRQALAKKGEAVVANQSQDKNLIAWAESQGLMVRIDRSSKYGNPFVMGQDGDRDFVCDAFEKHYLPHKQSIRNDFGKLQGKVLVCHCYPDRCHGDTLIKKINKDEPT